MTNIFKIHPSIGIARLGDSTTDFCLAPEVPMGLPIQCDDQGRTMPDKQGHEQPIDVFKDTQGRIKRQGARFRIYVYQDTNDKIGRELRVGDQVEVRKPKTGAIYRTIVLGIEWKVYLANKKSNWYKSIGSEGEHGYAADHPLRNAAIKDPTARQRLLIIDPGPQTVSFNTGAPHRAEFAKGKNPTAPQSFPTTLSPKNIDTLGEIIANQQDDYSRLIVLGGHGHSGAFKLGANEPRIQNTNNDGWFDDVSDGPVTATLWLQHLLDDCDLGQDLSPFTIPVDDPAWVLVTYPGYIPTIENMTNLDDVVYDVAVREMDYNPEMYGPVGDDRVTDTAQAKGWNKHYHPDFSRDIWSILRRPSIYQWLTDGTHGNFDLASISIPNHAGQTSAQRQVNAARRQSVFELLRKPGQSSNILRLTETQLFLLQQWVDGKFSNNRREADQKNRISGSELDRAVLWNTLGGAFAPNGEVSWVVRNPLIYAGPYRIKHAAYEPGWLNQPAIIKDGNVRNLSRGLEPGDLTKYSALPWQADFNECANQDVDVTYESWRSAYIAGSEGIMSTDTEKGVFWWAAHRPMQVSLPLRDPIVPRKNDSKNQVPWMQASSHITAKDLQRANAWATFGFIDNIDLEDFELVGTENDPIANNLHRLLNA